MGHTEIHPGIDVLGRESYGRLVGEDFFFVTLKSRTSQAPANMGIRCAGIAPGKVVRLGESLLEMPRIQMGPYALQCILEDF
ncbi:MAG: hypothetical protein VCE91_16645 [Nitrospinota bacterium]